MNASLTHFRQYWAKQISLGYTIAQGRDQSDRRAARRNTLIALMLVLLFNICVLYALAAWSLWPLIFGVVFFFWLAHRDALRHGDRSLRIRDRLLHSMQMYLDQIPIFIGQLNYRTRRRKSR